MIEGRRSNYDGDFPNKLHQMMPHQTKDHSKEIRCSVCGNLYYVDEETFKEMSNLMKHDLDNQFLCEVCDRDYQDAAFE